MRTSDSLTKIAPALVKAQQAITFAKKDAKNPFFNSKYADLPTVIDAVKPALNSNGITFIQTPARSGDEVQHQGSVQLYLTTRLLHESGEWIEDTAACPLVKQDPQAYGSAVTYLRRYCLAAIVGLYQDDDDGEGALRGKQHEAAKNAANEQANPNPPASLSNATADPITKATAETLSKMCSDGATATIIDKSLTKLGLMTIGDMTETEGQKLLNFINNKKK